MLYTNSEKVDMLKCYKLCNNNSKATAIYVQKYINRKIPSSFIFPRLVNKLSDYSRLTEPSLLLK